MKKIAIIGSGDLGQLIAHHAIDSGFEVAGFFDDYKTAGEIVGKYSILGNLNSIQNNYASKIFDFLICGIGYKHMAFRENIYTQYSATIPFCNIIHSTTNIQKTTKFGNGIFILPGCVLDHNVEIGNNVLLNTGCIIAHDSKVNANSFISPAVKIAGFSKIGKNCLIGIGTIVIDNIDICDGVQTGAGTVVTKSLEEPGLYIGTPANKIKSLS